MDICCKQIDDMLEKLVELTHANLMDDIETADTDECGKVVDMIKDLAASKRYLAQACYYHEVTEAMHDGVGTDIGDIMMGKPFADAVTSIKNVWRTADAASKKQMKDDLTKLINEMV